jgi:hypothetical protein
LFFLALLVFWGDATSAQSIIAPSNYVVVDLTSKLPAGVSTAQINGGWTDASGTHLVGVSQNDSGGNALTESLIFDGIDRPAAVLNPPHSVAEGAIGSSPISYQYGLAIVGPFASTHAVVWSGTAQSAVDIHPSGLPGETYGYGGSTTTGGFQVVGKKSLAGRDSAVLWSGNSPQNLSFTDLHPAGAYESVAYGAGPGLNGVAQQVGTSEATSVSQSHAALWTGSAQSLVDLNPSGAFSSTAYGASVIGNDAIQFGVSFFPIPNSYIGRATVWEGTAQSATYYDAPGFQTVVASAANDRFLVGYTYTHALVWDIDTHALTDLGALIPGFASYATFIDPAGNVYGYYGIGGSNSHPVAWLLVPEPSATAIVFWGLFVMCRRRGPKQGRKTGTQNAAS